MTDEQSPVDSPKDEGGAPSQDARTMAMLAHLLGIVLGFLGPLIIWLIKKDEEPFVDDQAKEALNFQLTVFIAMFISGLLICLVIGLVTTPAIAIADLVFCIIAGLKANEGEAYRYPLTLRLIK
jgi:uncharacterized Tic20 family protein